MSILILADHDSGTLKSVTRNVITAAKAIGGDIHVLIAGANCAGAAAAAAKCAGVSKVLVADAPAYANGLAENVAPLIVELGRSYTHILAAHTTYGKNVLPRAAALLDVAMISDIIAIDSPDTFQRPFYAGNAIATVRSKDAIKVLSVRGTGFDPSSAEGGGATVDAVASVHDAGTSQFVRDEIPERNRPELTAARVVISGGRGMQNSKVIAAINKDADAPIFQVADYGLVADLFVAVPAFEKLL